MRHQQGYWYGIWSDMYIETTLMRYGKGPGGIVGVTLKPGVVIKWANSSHKCTEILKYLDEMRAEKHLKMLRYLEFHKEETESRIKSDEEDRAILRDTLKKCINPLELVLMV